MSEERFRFMKDDDGHVYLIPAELKELFMALEDIGYTTNAYNKFIDTFDQYRVGESISGFTFTDPRRG